MATSIPTKSQEKIAEEFLSNAADYFRTEIKCMFVFY